jgi:hypothetical protein
MKFPEVRDRSDLNVNCGVVTGRNDLCSGTSVPKSVAVPGGDSESVSDRSVAKSEKPVTARPDGAGPVTSLPAGATAVLSKGAHADLTTNKLARGPAIANPQLGYRNPRS